jgi:23S rRNA pseudouridine1911/1915/1917 synthase
MASRKKAKQLIDEGRVFIGSKKIIIASWELQAGDKVDVVEAGEASVPRRSRYLKIYHEDPDLLVVEKPPGVACERTAQTLSSTLVDDINDYLRRAHPTLEYPYLGLMHRLDRETSGVMVYTLSKRANALAQQFKGHRVGRKYLALVEGKVPRHEGVIEKAIVKDWESGGRRMTALSGGPPSPAARARTRYQVLERYPEATLVEAELQTGRTHQVRVHFAAIGHPVVGDRTYGSGGTAQRQAMPIGRQALHASYLEFRHPVTGKRMLFRSKPPKDFQKLMEKFRAASVGLQFRRRGKSRNRS